MTLASTVIDSPWLGPIDWDPKCELRLPHGLPGFEQERRMLPVEIPAQRPLVFLQSLVQPDVCFVCMPVLVIDPAFALTFAEEERIILGIPQDDAPMIGRDVLCLGLLVPCGDTVQVNLAAPIVISLLNSVCLQVVAPGMPENRVLQPDGKWVPTC